MSEINQLLKEKQFLSDPVGDRVVAAIVEHAGEAGEMTPVEVAQMLSGTARFGPGQFHDLCDHHPDIAAAMKEFLEVTESRVPFVSEEVLKEGNHPFEDNAVFGFMVLGCTSLLECYCWAIEAEVLGITHQLTEHLERRIPETAQFVLDVMGDDAFIGHHHTPDGGCNPDEIPIGIEAVQKIRLMHSLMRWLIMYDPANAANAEGNSAIPDGWRHMLHSEWSMPEKGYPISQTFLAGTLLTFSWVIIHGMRKMWIGVSKEHGREYLQIWRVVGYKLGIDADLLKFFESEESAAELHAAMMENYRSATTEGTALAAALESFMIKNIVDHIPAHKLLGMQHFPRIVMWHLAGSETATTVGMVPGFIGRTLGGVIWLGLRILGFMERLPMLHHLSRKIFNWLGRSMWGWRARDEVVDHRNRRPTIAAKHADKWRIK